MLSMLITFVFTIVANLVNTMMKPFIAMILLIFPNTTTELGHVITWFGYAFQYLGCVYRWFLFTPLMFQLLFDYFAVKFAVYIAASAIRSALKLYNTLKP